MEADSDRDGGFDSVEQYFEKENAAYSLTDKREDIENSEANFIAEQACFDLVSNQPSKFGSET